MTREEDELSEQRHNEQFDPDWPFTEDPKPLPKSHQVTQEELEADFLDLVDNSGTGLEASRGLKK